jgi:cell division protein FtsX
MDLIQFLVTLFIFALLLGLFNWACRQFPEFLNGTVIKIINVVAIICIVLWVIGVLLGGWGSFGHIRIGR